MAEQVPFGADADLAFNTEPRCACVLLVDVSGSMCEIVSGAGESLGQTMQMDGKSYTVVNGGVSRIDLLNEGLQAYATDVKSDGLAAQRVEVCVITFGSTVETVVPFTIAGQFDPPKLQANCNTRMGEAILRAIASVEERKAAYKRTGIPYFRPWIFLITDGEPTDSWKEAAEKVQEGEHAKKFAFFSVGVEGANFDTLGQISKTRQPLPLKGYSFREMFLWLSSSQRSVSASKPGQEDQLGLSSPKGWANL